MHVVTTTLITGMSATGKSSTVAQLIANGHRAIDLDVDEWSHLVPDDSGYADPATDRPLDWHWREEKMHTLLAAKHGTLFVAGTSTHQARLYPLLDHIVLLTVPGNVALDRLANRTTNDYGKDPAELRRELDLRSVVEPALRESACLEVDTSAHSTAEVAEIIAAHARSRCPRTG